MLRPDYKEFSRIARESTLVPVVKSITADLLTPVSAFLAVAANEPYAFLLESVERGEQIGRYTFLGARPYMQVRAEGGDIVIQRGKHKEKRQGSAIQVVKELLRQHRPAMVPGLPPFTAGAVGYFAYDAVRELENIGKHAKNDLLLPDCVLMFSTAYWRLTTCVIRFISSPTPTYRGRVRDGPMTAPPLISQFWKRSWLRACGPRTGIRLQRRHRRS